MRSLGKKGESFILDYCFGLTSGERTAHVEALLAHNQQAADFYARIQAALAPLARLEPERCPEELAMRTIRLLCAIAQTERAATRPNITYPCLRRLEDHWQCPLNNILAKSLW
jgi:anti-sigma-K factor RskA